MIERGTDEVNVSTEEIARRLTSTFYRQGHFFFRCFHSLFDHFNTGFCDFELQTIRDNVVYSFLPRAYLEHVNFCILISHEEVAVEVFERSKRY